MAGLPARRGDLRQSRSAASLAVAGKLSQPRELKGPHAPRRCAMLGSSRRRDKLTQLRLPRTFVYAPPILSVFSGLCRLVSGDIQAVNNIRSTLAAVWRIAAPYFSSDDKWAGRGLLAAVVVMELAAVFLTVLFNRWNNVFYNALQDRNQAVFTYQIGYFCVLATFWVALKVYQLYLNQWLQIRWRRWMTARYLSGWLHHSNHYRMQLSGDAADNPDQRIAEDTQRFVEQTLTLGIGLLISVVTLACCVVILGGLSNEAPLHLFGNDIAIPGYLVWGAIIYALLGTVLTHLIGWPLVGLNFQQQRYEADFRFNLVRARENSEQIALLHGDNTERERNLERFGRVASNCSAILHRRRNVTAFPGSYAQAAVVFPYILAAPAYFANKMQLGRRTQT